MDLIGASWTYDTTKPPVDKDAFYALIHSIEYPEDEPIPWDHSGTVSDGNVDDWRNLLMDGAQEYEDAIGGHRMSIEWSVGDRDDRSFVFTGGGSWGDDPFDGFTPLTLFLNAVDEEHGGITGAQALTNFIGGGIVVD
jgi:hypothetical protein